METEVLRAGLSVIHVGDGAGAAARRLKRPRHAISTTTEEAMLARAHLGGARKAAIEQQIQVGRAFDAEDFVEVSQVHLMADTESLGESGVAYHGR